MELDACTADACAEATVWLVSLVSLSPRSIFSGRQGIAAVKIVQKRYSATSSYIRSPVTDNTVSNKRQYFTDLIQTLEQCVF